MTDKARLVRFGDIKHERVRHGTGWNCDKSEGYEYHPLSECGYFAGVKDDDLVDPKSPWIPEQRGTDG